MLVTRSPIHHGQGVHSLEVSRLAKDTESTPYRERNSSELRGHREQDGTWRAIVLVNTHTTSRHSAAVRSLDAHPL